MASRYIDTNDLGAWLDHLSAARRVLTPQERGGSVVFRQHEAGAVPELSRQATASPKKAVFPASEKLAAFRYVKDPEDPGRVAVELEETIEVQPTVVVGGRPCDARGFLTFDRVYDTPKIRDVYYAARREATLFVTLACERAERTCFCHAVGSGPADTEGSDVLMTPVRGGWVLEAVSERGETWLADEGSGTMLTEAGDKAAEAAEVRSAAEKTLPAAPEFEGSPAGLLAHFDDMAFWEAESAKCISCGACTYLCPTCYCFNITDEDCGSKGVRLRSWDNCMSFQFTMEASGHNPRPTKAHRLKNRVGHKFSYYPDLHGGAIACCGCGRCIKSCPVCVDIREIVTHAIENQPADETA